MACICSCVRLRRRSEGLSSCESEFLALVKAGSIGMGAKAMAKDFGMDLKLKLETDSSGAKGVAARRGVGRIRHLHTPLLWLQRRVADRTLRVFKVDGKTNEADIGTKALAQADVVRILTCLGFHFEKGASTRALQAAR